MKSSILSYKYLHVTGIKRVAASFVVSVELVQTKVTILRKQTKFVKKTLFFQTLHILLSLVGPIPNRRDWLESRRQAVRVQDCFLVSCPIEQAVPLLAEPLMAQLVPQPAILDSFVSF